MTPEEQSCYDAMREDNGCLRLEFTHSARTCEMLQADNERLRYAIKVERGKTEKADEDNERLRGRMRLALQHIDAGSYQTARYVIDAALGTQVDLPPAAVQALNEGER